MIFFTFDLFNMKQQMNLLSKFDRGYQNRLSTFSRIQNSIRSNALDSVNIVFRTWSHLVSLLRNNSVFPFLFFPIFIYLSLSSLFFHLSYYSCYYLIFDVSFICAQNNIIFLATDTWLPAYLLFFAANRWLDYFPSELVFGLRNQNDLQYFN